MRALVCCACNGIPLSAQATYRTITGENPPIVWKGSRISVLMEIVPQHSPIYEHLRALSKQTGKFAYAFEWDMDGNVKRKYNLLSGKEIK